jgi:lipoprotein NlpD
MGNPGNWHWPTTGPIIKAFSLNRNVNKGIDLGGKLGEAVSSAGDGTVVYAGNGILGYGNLIIIKHNQEFLSAYAHNSRVLVEEGTNVKVGQVIAEIGSSGTDRNKLHFEVRREGKPVNPLYYLPRR